MSNIINTIEGKALRFYELNRTIRQAEEEKELIKKSISAAMKDGQMENYTFRLDDTSDLKVTVAPRTTKKLDKEELADDLGISLQAAGQKDVLIKKTEEGRLTAARFKGYMYQETTEQVTIRKVNA